jgi:hypothetical protein
MPPPTNVLPVVFCCEERLMICTWPMSYSRWRDDRFRPAFRDALLTEHPDISANDLDRAREYNRLRYHYQGIGRYEPDRVYARGIEDLRGVADNASEAIRAIAAQFDPPLPGDARSS